MQQNQSPRNYPPRTEEPTQVSTRSVNRAGRPRGPRVGLGDCFFAAALPALAPATHDRLSDVWAGGHNIQRTLRRNITTKNRRGSAQEPKKSPSGGSGAPTIACPPASDWPDPPALFPGNTAMAARELLAAFVPRRPAAYEEPHHDPRL